MEEIFCDVLIAGGGNAALSAAITAAEKGHSVIVADRAPYHMRGGNTRHTRNIQLNLQIGFLIEALNFKGL